MADEIVYAIHDFVAENEDEIPFNAGDSIVVLEKDEKYMDGWWQVRHTKKTKTRARGGTVRLLTRLLLPGPQSAGPGRSVSYELHKPKQACGQHARAQPGALVVRQ